MDSGTDASPSWDAPTIDMRGIGRSTNRVASASDAELGARLSRLRSELTQARRHDEDDDAFRVALQEIEQQLAEAERLAEEVAGPNATASGKDTCLRAVHEVEAAMCLVKPSELLYTTWIGLREKLYRFDDKERQNAWRDDISARFGSTPEELDAPEPASALRQRLRQLTLELRESALRFNRLNEERTAVRREVIDLGVWLIASFGALLLLCLTLTTYVDGAKLGTLVSLLTGIAAGGMGAVFSTFGTHREERERTEFTEILKSDLRLHVAIGTGAALLVTVVLLSGKLFPLPPERLGQAAYLAAGGFGAGFSDRFWKGMLKDVIPTRGRGSRGRT